ncbi:hypothetical protein LCGC14_0578220 [marine sediment metagenome]|uniref:Uncharacterized protein n=1 Tax=marine sediment metagenome TaxID=412755 RepID=A0A0F9U3H8_9ZZZZ
MSILSKLADNIIGCEEDAVDYLVECWSQENELTEFDYEIRAEAAHLAFEKYLNEDGKIHTAKLTAVLHGLILSKLQEALNTK